MPAAEAKQKTAADALALALKTGLEELGATVTADGRKLRVSFPVGKVIDANGMDVSETGQAALKILAGAAKKESAKVRVVARTSSAPPPKELRSLFHTAGEMRRPPRPRRATSSISRSNRSSDSQGLATRATRGLAGGAGDLRRRGAGPRL